MTEMPDPMPTHEEHILRILGEADGSLFPSLRSLARRVDRPLPAPESMPFLLNEAQSLHYQQ